MKEVIEGEDAEARDEGGVGEGVGGGVEVSCVCVVEEGEGA